MTSSLTTKDTRTMKNIARALLATLAVTAIAACEAPPPPPPPPPPPVAEPPPPPPKPVIPAYEPTGEFAEIKKGAAAGIDENNALAKATAVEAELDTAIKALEEAKAAKAAPKK
jgi:hypothetical protein